VTTDTDNAGYLVPRNVAARPSVAPNSVLMNESNVAANSNDVPNIAEGRSNDVPNIAEGHEVGEYHYDYVDGIRV
jgi:hypothetical protein